MTNFDSDEALARFERALAQDGRREEACGSLGPRKGIPLRIGPYEFTYS